MASTKRHTIAMDIGGGHRYFFPPQEHASRSNRSSRQTFEHPPRRSESYSGPPRPSHARRMPPPPPPPRVLRPLSIHVRRPAPGTGDGGSPLLHPQRHLSFRSSIYQPEETLILEENSSATIPILANRPRLPDITLRFLLPANPNAPLLPLNSTGLHSPFSPACNDHLISFIRTSSLLMSSGVDKIVGVATEDIFVMNAWSQAHNLTGKPGEVTLASDGNGELCRRLCMPVDLSHEIMGARKRYKRFVMLVERDLSISRYATEPDDDIPVNVTSAARVLSWLQ
ncbi:hypothetical protein BDF22DRAFT_744467 [Syncephalis plumigaleata]|nr:hypothetical protein BDF22DRAFT_744467 [Syncephalis plumigaleata]